MYNNNLQWVIILADFPKAIITNFSPLKYLEILRILIALIAFRIPKPFENIRAYTDIQSEEKSTIFQGSLI